MSETVNQEPNNNAQTAEGGADQSEKLFTQEQVNSFFNKRYSEMMSKISEYEEKAKKFDELEEASKSELEKATEKAAKLEAELKSLKKAAEVQAIKDKISQETGVPASLLSGETEESIKAQADAIKTFASTAPAYPQIKDGGEVVKTSKLDTRQLFAQAVSKMGT